MSNSPNDILQNAFELIEKGELEQAQAAIAPLFETENDNPALWWVYTHTVSDSATGIAALERVLQLDPRYPGAQELKAEVAAEQSAGIAAAAHGTAGAAAQATAADIDDWDDVQATAEVAAQATSQTRAGRGFVLTIIVLLIAAAGALLALSGELDFAALLDTFAPAAAPSELPAVSTAEPLPAEAAAFFALVGDALADFEIDEAASTVRETELGNTLDIWVCAAPGSEFDARLSAALEAAASLDAEIPEDVEAVAVSLLNCADDEAAARTIGVERSAIRDYAAGQIDVDDFRELWKPLS